MKHGRVANLQKSLVQSAELVMLDLEARVGVQCFVNLVTCLLHDLKARVGVQCFVNLVTCLLHDLKASVGVQCFVNLVTCLLHDLNMLVMEAMLCAHYVLV
jgi:hypothetical protein